MSDEQSFPSADNLAPADSSPISQANPSEAITSNTAEEIHQSDKAPVISKKIHFLIITTALLVITAAAAFYLGRTTQVTAPTMPQEEVMIPEPSITATPEPDPTADWKVFTDNTFGFSFKYPPDMTLRDDSASITTVYMSGPTQKGGTEMYDGFSVTFIPEMTNSSPMEYAQANTRQVISDGMAEVLQEPANYDLHGYQAVTYIIEGLGVAQHVVVQNDKKESVVDIALVIADPTDQGFQQIADQILSTFKFSTYIID